MLQQRARWLHQSSGRVLRALGIESRICGQAPSHGLVAANHLSYLDIAIISAAMPCFFVSKTEVGRWPYFGRAARTGGTIFIDRSSRASTAAVAAQMAERFRLSIPVLLFPEGTSSDGSQVLRFHPSLFDPAIVAGTPITAASVRYIIDDGSKESELCWFGDSLFLPHLWKVLGTTGFSAEVRFGEPRVYTDRRAAALATHDEVVAMREKRLLATSY
jgi:1-acyl-sn-glycerol-3-phosphate acyltransferase